LCIAGILSACSITSAGAPLPASPAAKTTPTITWKTPAAVPLATTLGTTQLDAKASVPGKFSYSPAAGTVLSKAGTVKLSVTFTPANLSEYTTATASVELTVNKATPKIAWDTPEEVPAGTRLSAAQLDATANVPGKFTYSPSAGTVLAHAGKVKLSATFSPTDTADYLSATATVQLTVTIATPVIVWKTPVPVPYGTTLGPIELDATANVPGSFTYSPVAGSVLTTAGKIKLFTTFVPKDTADYTSATASVELTVDAPATPAISAITPASAPVGASVTIAGTNFGAAKGSSTVIFGSATAATTAWSKDSITAKVPSLAPGAVNVSVSVDGKTSHAESFTILAVESACTTPSNEYGTIPIDNNTYIYQQNEWNSNLPQCATVIGESFTLTTADYDQPNGAPATYPSIFRGCHWGNCTANSPFPIQESKLSTASTTVDTTEVPGNYDVAYDIWFNQTPTTDGQPDGTEVMIWIDHSGFPQPAGSQTGVATIDGVTWEVWTGTDPSWNIVSYLQETPTSSVKNLNLLPFFDDAVSRGSLQTNWYLIDVEMGFEVWTGGKGLGISNFSVNATAK
jgi:hypothetical protein